MTNTPDRQQPKVPSLGRLTGNGQDWFTTEKQLPDGSVAQGSIVFRPDGGITSSVVIKSPESPKKPS